MVIKHYDEKRTGMQHTNLSQEMINVKHMEKFWFHTLREETQKGFNILVKDFKEQYMLSKENYILKRYWLLK